jgi:integrase
MEKHARKRTRLATWRSYESSLNRYVLTAWRGRSVREIKRRDVIDLIESVEAPYAANRLLATLSAMFNWLASRDVIAASPCSGVARPHPEKPRERVLDDGELARLWDACGKLGRNGDFIKLLLLTGCRRSEIAEATWDEIDGEKRELVIPPERAKNKRRHVVPLVPQAWEIIARQPRASRWLFPAHFGGGPMTGFHHVMRHLEVAVTFDPPIRLHDLRRSTASGLQRLGVPVELIEQILGHWSGTFRGIVGVYQRHDYSAEKRAALTRWADHLSGQDGKIVPFQKRS